ncbi:putative oxidoreductase GLYR1 homolog [Trichonephila inaurata madagascariensis]|uniref:Putative oxidoreductase GLYR1 homolog n=1 Tax=Trichonephila inaurata madagascariensis TaxID=2747483 RepID=A0A8X6MD89_9ARAC|nr:putative oxidoreductase GLYR1 homolog [Trichonephila inaurata madagascariensis]
MEFEIDQFVWISSTDVSFIMKTFLSDTNFPFWVGKIEKPPADTPSKSEKTQHFVRLCGTMYCSWMSEETIHHLSDEMFLKTAESNFILKTLVEVIKAGGLIDSKSEPATIKNDESTIALLNPKDVTEVPFISDEGLPDAFPASVLSCEIKHASEKVKHSSEKTTKETPRKRKLTEEESEPKSSPVQNLHRIFSKYFQQNPCHYKFRLIEMIRQPIPLPGTYMLLHPTRKPSFKVPRETRKKIGFIGLGKMGQIIVKNLLQSGYDVSIWNKTEVKCPKFVEDGAQRCWTPSQLVHKCDIIFSCFSDRDVKSSVFLHDGILEGLKNCEQPGTKVYVEMTSIDPSTSREIAEAVMGHGGKYLEAPICCSERLAESGFLLIICCGDLEVFKSCQSYFEAFSSDVLYENKNIGYGSKLRLAVSMLVGNTYASLLDSVAFVKGCSISQNSFLNTLQLIFTSSSFLKAVEESIRAENLSTHILINLQQDLSWALSLADSMNMPLSMTCSANEKILHMINEYHT